MMKQLRGTAVESVRRTALGRLFVRRLMKSGARGRAEEILESAAEIVRRKVPNRPVEFVLESSVADRQIHIYLHWLLKHRASGGSVRIMEDFRGMAVAAIVKAANRETAPTMDRRLAAAILKGYADQDPGPKGRTSGALRLSARHAYAR